MVVSGGQVRVAIRSTPARGFAENEDADFTVRHTLIFILVGIHCAASSDESNLTKVKLAVGAISVFGL